MTESKQPQYWTSPDKRVAIKLNMLPGDHALVAALSPEGTKALGVFLYPDGTVTIIGSHDRSLTILMAEKTIQTLKTVPAIANLAPTPDPENPS